MTLAQVPIVLFYRNGSTLCRVLVDDKDVVRHRFHDLEWRDINFPWKEKVILADICMALRGSDEVTDTTARFNIV